MPCQAQHVGPLEEGDGMGDRWRRYVGSGEPALETSQGEAQTTVPEPTDWWAIPSAFLVSESFLPSLRRSWQQMLSMYLRRAQPSFLGTPCPRVLLRNCFSDMGFQLEGRA